MGRIVEYAGRRSPHENLEGFIKMVQSRYPGIKTNRQLSQLVARATIERKQRFKGFSFVLFGRDVLSGDLASNPAWTFIPGHIDRNIRRMSADERMRLISVPGLEQTYVWCVPVDWLQEVGDEDYERLRMSPYWQYFRDVELQGRHIEVRSYDHYEFERIPASNLDDGNRIMAERKLHNYVPGAKIAHNAGEQRP